MFLLITLNFSLYGMSLITIKTFRPDCATDSKKFKKLVEKERVYDFLAGLNLGYDPVQIQILEKDPFPTLMQAYSYVQGEESRRNPMLHSPSQDRSAMMTTPQIDKEQRRAKGKIDLVMQKSQSVTTVEKLGTVEKNAGNYTVVLPKVAVLGTTKSNAHMIEA